MSKIYIFIYGGSFVKAILTENNNGYVGKIYVDNTYNITTNNKNE